MTKRWHALRMPALLEVRNGFKVRRKPSHQPHELHIALAFTLQAAARLDAVEAPIEVELQHDRWLVR